MKSNLEAEKNKGTFVDPRLAVVLFSDWAYTVFQGKKRRLRPSGYERDESHLRNHVLPHFGSTKIGSIRRSDVNAWVGDLDKKGLAPRTVRDCYAVLRSIMADAVEERIIPETPCRRIPLPRIPPMEARFLTHEEVALLADSIDERSETMVLTAAYMGLRWGEISGLKRNHLNLLRKQMTIAGALQRAGNRFIYVEETKTVKCKRLLDIPPPLVERLAHHLQVSRPSEYVFPAPAGGPLNYHSFRSASGLPQPPRRT